MTRRFDCTLCNKIFSSAYEMAQHFRSDEHREKGNGANLDSLIEKFIEGVKTSIEKGDKNGLQKTE